MLTVAELAAAKGFTVEELEILGVRNGHGIVHIPYHLVDGTEYPRLRERSHLIAKKGTIWEPGRDEPSIPYGLYQPIPITDSVFVVEGESDSWALWTTGFPAIGIPGATSTGCLRAEHVGSAHDVHVIQEPDDAGTRFPQRVANALYDSGFSGQVYAGTMLDGFKDPQAAFAALDRHDFIDLMGRVIAGMTPILRPRPVVVEVARSVPQPVGAAYIKRLSEPADPRRYLTGNTFLDSILGGGLFPAQQSLWVARSGSGKSGLIEQLSMCVSEPKFAPNNKALLFPLEMGVVRTEIRMVAKILKCTVAEVNRLQQSKFPDDQQDFQKAMKALRARNLHMVAPRSDEAFDLDAIMEIIIDQKPNIVFIDQLRSIAGWGIEKGLMRDQATGNTMRKLYAFGAAHGIHIACAHQLKLIKLKKGQRPEEDDLADGAQIFQTADVVVALHRPFKSMPEKDFVAELLPIKNREGGHEWVHVHFTPQCIAFPQMTGDEARRAPCCKAKEAPRRSSTIVG